MSRNIVDSFVEVRLLDPSNFNKIRETLTRIGFPLSEEKKLFQSCHILHKRGRYYIVHFKELFLLDGKQADFSDNDRARRDRITRMLRDWKLLEIVDESKLGTGWVEDDLEVIPYRDKKDWKLVAKYSIGSRK